MLAWNKSRFTFKKKTSVNLDDVTEELDFQGILNSDQQIKQFKRGHVALIVQLKDNDTGLDILVTTIHAFWDPKFQYVKYAEVAYVCDLISNMKKRQKIKGPIIIGGDFNSLPYSDVVRYLYKLDRAELLNPKMPGAQIKKPLIVRKVIEKFASFKERITFRSAYDMYFQNSNQFGMENAVTWSRMLKVSHPQFTNWTMKFKDTLDYIFYTPQNCELVELKSLPRIEDMFKIKVKKLPDGEIRHGSDHLLIGAVFSYKKKVAIKRIEFNQDNQQETVEGYEDSMQKKEALQKKYQLQQGEQMVKSQQQQKEQRGQSSNKKFIQNVQQITSEFKEQQQNTIRDQNLSTSKQNKDSKNNIVDEASQDNQN